MSLSSRFLRRSLLCLLCMIGGVCAAQVQQFQSVPQVQPTNGQVMSFLPGTFQQGSTRPDFLYVNAPVGSGASSSITAGVELIGQVGQGFSFLPASQIQFTGVSNVVAALGDFNNDGNLDVAFALTPSGSTTTNLCVYYGTGATAASQSSSFSGGGVYPALGTSGCMNFGPANGGVAPKFSYIAAMPFNTAAGSLPQLLVEDSANKLLYVIVNAGTVGSGGVLNGFRVTSFSTLADGAGPICTGDFKGDGIMDFVVNGQTGYSATVYLGDGTGGFVAQPRYVFDDGVRSMLLHDMNGDRLQDMVVETNHGAIEIHRGVSDGSFSQVSSGGTAQPNGLVVPGSVAGNGGHLAAINPNTLDILTTTPIGLSLLREPGGLVYSLSTIYNIGPGRNSFALTNVYTMQSLDLEVDSAEGVAIIAGNPDGTFQSSKAYAALAPALGAVVGKFRNAASNPAGNVDVVVGTGATQAQLLRGNGDGTFAALASTVNPSGGPGNVPAGVWSNILSGDLTGDGYPDLLFSLTGLPLVPPSGNSPELFALYGNGDGTFGGQFTLGANAANDTYGESAVADFQGFGYLGIAIDNEVNDRTLTVNSGVGLFRPDSNNTSFNQVAAGFFKLNRSSQLDVVFQENANFIPCVNGLNNTGANFTVMPALVGAAAPLYASTVLLTDLNGDGYGDLVVVYYNAAANPVGAGPVSPYQVWIWYGNGDGTFQSPQILSLSRNYYLGAVADMNGDGLPDLVLSDGSIIDIVYNLGGGKFYTTPPVGGTPSLVEQHFVAGQGINSITLQDVNGDGVPDIIAANGGATISNALAIGGKTQPSIALTANPSDINTGGITVLLNGITTKPVTGTLVANPEPSIYGQPFVMTATLISSAGVAPTGQVSFYLDGVNLGLGLLFPVSGSTTSSAATFTVPLGNAYLGGVHVMTATFGGDTSNTAVTLYGAVGAHLIQGGSTTSEIFMCFGPNAACPAPPGVPSPSPPYVSMLTMYYGQIWNGFVDVRSNDGTALTGFLYLDDAYTGPDVPPPNPLCTLSVVGGVCPNSVGTTQGTSVGLNVLTAYYPGDATHTASTSGPVAITVLPDTTTATLSGSLNPSPALLPVTLTATVTGNFVAPTGPVVFYNGSNLLGQINLVPGSGTTSTASLTTSTLPVGSDLITVNYGATMDFNAASASFTEVITPSLAGSFTVTVAPTPVSVGAGYSTLLAVTVTPQGGFSQDVKLSCANLPNEGSCFFDSAVITGGSGTTNLVLGTTAPHSCGTTQPYFLGANGGGGFVPYALPALAGLLAIFLPGRRRWLRSLAAVIVAIAAMHMTACGNCTDLGTRPATYTFQVTGTAAGTSEVEAQTVTITVTI